MRYLFLPVLSLLRVFKRVFTKSPSTFVASVVCLLLLSGSLAWAGQNRLPASMRAKIRALLPLGLAEIAIDTLEQQSSPSVRFTVNTSRRSQWRHRQ